MNRILCRRYAVNIFWAAVYGCLLGYVFYANYVARLNPVAMLEREAISAVTVGKHGNVGNGSDDDKVTGAIR